MASARIRRWALKLSNYNYAIQFRRTDDIPNADALSRLPSPLESGPAQEELVLLIEPDWLDAKDMARLTSKDVTLSNVLRFVQCGKWPAANIDDRFKPLQKKSHELSQTAGVLLWGHRVVVPEAARRMVLRELHAGHPGIVRMKAAARAVVWWPGIDDDIERAVRTCRPCQESRCSPQRAELHMWPWPGRPWSRLHIDFAELTKGKSILVVVDSHSKWIEAEIMSSTTSSLTVNKLRAMFARWGIPDMICTDNATTFTSHEFQEFLRGNGVTHRTIEPKHSRGNGLAERAVKEVKLAVSRGQQDGVVMELALQCWLFQQRTIQHSTTSVSPAELMMGRRPKTRLDLLYPDLGKEVQSQQVKQRFYADRSAKARGFCIGDIVYARNYAVGKAWLPATVLGVDGPVSFVVRLDDGRIWRRHCEQLRERFVDVDSDEPDFPDLTPPSEEAAGGDIGSPAAESTSPLMPRHAPVLRPDAGVRPVAPPAAAAASSEPMATGEKTAAPDTAPDLACGGGEPRLGAAEGAAEAAAGSHPVGPVATSTGGAELRRSARVRRSPDFYTSEQF